MDHPEQPTSGNDPPATGRSAPVVACPTCQASVVWSTAQRWRPFCSERCKLIDLGAWATERYSMAAGPVNPEAPMPASDT